MKMYLLPRELEVEEGRRGRDEVEHASGPEVHCRGDLLVGQALGPALLSGYSVRVKPPILCGIIVQNL